MRRAPIRTCISCKRRGEQSGFLRVVRTADESASISGQGRSAYLCPSEACIRTAFARKILPRALRAEGKNTDWKALETQILEKLTNE